MIQSKTALFVVYLMGIALSAFGQDSPPTTILLDGELLVKTKMRLKDNDSALSSAERQLLVDAERALCLLYTSDAADE